MEASSRDRYHGIYFEYASVSLLIQHAKHMHCIIICGLFWLYRIFPHSLVNGTIFGKRYHHHHHLPPWVRSIELFRHRCIAIVSEGIHNFVIWSANIQGCASWLMSTLLSLDRLPAHLPSPNSWRTSLSLLVWLLSYGPSSLEGPTRNIKFQPT